MTMHTGEKNGDFDLGDALHQALLEDQARDAHGGGGFVSQEHHDVGEEKASIEAESAGLEEDGNGQGEVWSFQYGERAVQLDRRGKESDGSCGSVETGDDNDILEEVSCTDEELPEILEVKEAGMPLPERDLNSDLIMDSFESYESISPLLKNLSKESQDLLRDREIEDDTECLLCGEFGHGIKDCPYKEPEVEDQARENDAPSKDEEQEIEGNQEEDDPPLAGEQEQHTAVELIQRNIRLWIVRKRSIAIFASLREGRRNAMETQAAEEAATTARVEAKTVARRILNEIVNNVSNMGKTQQEEAAAAASEALQIVIDSAVETGEDRNNIVDVHAFALDILDFLIVRATEVGAMKRAAAEAAWRSIEAELEATAKREAEESAAEEELAERRRLEEAEKMAMTRAAVMMQTIFRGGQARAFTRQLREMRLQQQRGFEEEATNRACEAISHLKYRIPLQVHDFKQHFDVVLEDAVTLYEEKSASIGMKSDDAAKLAITSKITALWPEAAIANEAVIAACLVDAARAQVRKGLVLGRMMKGAFLRETLAKGLDTVNTVAQEYLSAALREHLPMTPETVEERMASLKISIEAKKRLKTHVEVECDKMKQEMVELIALNKKDAAERCGLMEVLAGAEPGSALRLWAPMSHLPGELNTRILKSRERTRVKISIQDVSSICQKRWHALAQNLDFSRRAFTNSVLGIAGGRGWDSGASKAALAEQSAYALELADAFSHVSPPASAAKPQATAAVGEARTMRRRIADLFMSKDKTKKSAINLFKSAPLSGDGQPGVELSFWQEWKPGRFRRQNRESRYAEYCRYHERQEPQSKTEVDLDLGAPISPTELERRAKLAEEWSSQSSRSAPQSAMPYTVLPHIVKSNFNHVMAKLEREVRIRREQRDEKGQGRNSPALHTERWQLIKHISKSDPRGTPQKELFPTPRRLQKWRRRIDEVWDEVKFAREHGGYRAQGYAGGHESVLSILSGHETRAHSRLSQTASGLVDDLVDHVLDGARANNERLESSKSNTSSTSRKSGVSRTQGSSEERLLNAGSNESGKVLVQGASIGPAQPGLT